MTKFGKSGAAGWAKPAVTIIIVVGLAIIVIPKLINRSGSAPEDKPAVTVAAGSFKATDSQWATLAFARVESRLFRTERETDGKIAVNDDNTTPVFSPLSGRVIKVLAHAGDIVKKGDPLLLIDASEFVQGQNDLVTALGTLSAAKAQLAVAENVAQRQRDLYQAQGAALKDVQQSEADLASAHAAFASASISLAAARNRLRILGRSESEIAALESARDPQKMTAQAAVSAVIGGTILSRQVGPGEYINSAAANGGQIFTIGDLSSLWLVANLREADSAMVKLGDDVSVSVLAYPGRQFHGSLTYVAPAIDPISRRLAVRAEIANPDGALKPEMFASFRVTSAENGATAPAAPEAAIIYEGDKARLWVASFPDKTLSLRAVKIGRSSDGTAEILDGLKTGEMVVTKGALFIDRAAKGE